MKLATVDAAAAALRTNARAFTRRNLYHETRRQSGETLDYDSFAAVLARRLRDSDIPGLLPPPSRDTSRMAREHDAYFPAAILLVDRREIVDLFAASGVLVQARMAVVCVDGTPSTIVRWLVRGLRAGYRAPIGYLHDAATVLYPFAFEPLATAAALGRRETPLQFADLGLPPFGVASSRLPFCPRIHEPITELEMPPPAAIVAYAARRLAALLPKDPWLAPLSKQKGRA